MPKYCAAVFMLATCGIGSATSAVQPSIASLVQNATFFVPETSSNIPQLAEPGISDLHLCLINGTRSLQRIQLSRSVATGGVDNCRSSLLAFYNSSLALSELTSGHWQESEMDHTLCQAGLWYLHWPVCIIVL